jgi:hypothetical protein
LIEVEAVLLGDIDAVLEGKFAELLVFELVDLDLTAFFLCSHVCNTIR